MIDSIVPPSRRPHLKGASYRLRGRGIDSLPSTKPEPELGRLEPHASGLIVARHNGPIFGGASPDGARFLAREVGPCPLAPDCPVKDGLWFVGVCLVLSVSC
jgi:hypothetical protein